jgi:hypothetical protein
MVVRAEKDEILGGVALIGRQTGLATRASVGDGIDVADMTDYRGGGAVDPSTTIALGSWHSFSRGPTQI